MDWIGKKVRSNWLEFAQQTETQATQPLTQVVATQVTADNSPTRRHEDVESSSDSDATVDRGEDEEEDLFGRQLTYDEPNDTVTSTAPADDVVTSDEDSSSNDESDDTASNTESNESDDDDDAGTYNSQYESEGSDVDDDADEEQEEDEEPEEDEIEDLTVRPNKTSYPRVSCFIARVRRFFVRYVPNRTARTLQQWIIDLCAPNAQIATDSFSSYYGLEENARAQGKEITARMVNHQLTYKASDGTHTNSVEGMHLHARAFIRRLGQLGSVRIRRIWRVVGTAHIANPGAVPGSIPNAVSVCRFQRLLCGLKLVAGFGVPYKLVARMGATKKKLPHFAVASYDPLDKCFTLDGREGGNFTFDRPEESAAVAADALRVYEAEAAEERQTKKARTEGSLQESMKEKEAREKREARKAKELQRITERMEKAREKRVKSMAAAVKAQKDEIELGRKAARLARGAPADGDDDDEATPGRTRRARMPGDANSPTTRAPRTGGASSPTARAAATTTAPTAAAAPQ